MVAKHRRRFSIRPTLTVKGRTFHGLRGWSGKPFHPPLTDIPIAAFVLASVFDIVSVAGGDASPWARDFWRAGTYVLTVGLFVSLLAVLTGIWDAWRSSVAGTQARRTINTHAAMMSAALVLAAIDVVWRLVQFSEPVAPIGIAVLSTVVALVAVLGATYGGSLVFEFGFNVETGGDHHAWHQSELDVFPGQRFPDENAKTEARLPDEASEPSKVLGLAAK